MVSVTRDTQVVTDPNTIHEPNKKRKAQTQCPSPKKIKYCEEHKENQRSNAIRDDLAQKLNRVKESLKKNTKQTAKAQKGRLLPRRR